MLVVFSAFFRDVLKSVTFFVSPFSGLALSLVPSATVWSLVATMSLPVCLYGDYLQGECLLFGLAFLDFGLAWPSSVSLARVLLMSALISSSRII